MVARVVLETGVPPDWSGLLPKTLLGVLALLCGNGFIVGINQIYDVSIDLISKPFLPVAAQEMTIAQAWVMTLAMAAGGIGLARGLFGPLIGVLYTVGLLLGTAYSVPPLRLKQSPVAAALIIATVRGFLLNFGVYYAARAMLGVPPSWSPPVAFITCFCTLFAVVIAVTKDLPDVKGDVENRIGTFAARFGVSRVAAAATAMMVLNYASAALWAFGPAGHEFNPKVLLTSHMVLATLLIRGFGRLRKAGFSQEAIKAYYKLVWALFYCEYLLFPFV